MKKYILLSLLFLCSCAPSPTIRDKGCTDIKTIRVIRVSDDVVLGWTAKGADMKIYSPSTFYAPDDEHYIFLKRDPHQVYYPGQDIQLDDSVCLKYTGSYSYVVDDKYGAKTLKGVVEPAEYPNPEYEAYMAEKSKPRSSCWRRRRSCQTCNR